MRCTLKPKTGPHFLMFIKEIKDIYVEFLNCFNSILYTIQNCMFIIQCLSVLLLLYISLYDINYCLCKCEKVMFFNCISFLWTSLLWTAVWKWLKFCSSWHLKMHIYFNTDIYLLCKKNLWRTDHVSDMRQSVCWPNISTWCANWSVHSKFTFLLHWFLQ